jgi:glutathione S-transferase
MRKENAMKLYLNKTSPYARLVVVVAHEKGVAGQIEFAWIDPWTDSADLLSANPYSKVPTLVADDGQAIVDSVCICDYLDEVGGGRRLLPSQGADRLRGLRKYGLGRGLMDAAFGVTIERRFNGSGGEPALAKRWLAAVGRALERLERDGGLLGPTEAPDLGDLAIAIGLSYTEFRLPEVKWKPMLHRLSSWYEPLGSRPSMRFSAPE